MNKVQELNTERKLTELAHNVVDAKESGLLKNINKAIDDLAIFLGRKRKPYTSIEVGRHIREIREELGMSQEEIIQASGVEWSQSYLSELENGSKIRRCSKTTIKKYKQILKYYEEQKSVV